MKGFVEDIEKITIANTNFRKVLYTGQHAQLVVMCIMPLADIGEEVHEVTDQFLRIEEGEGKVILDGREHPISGGTAILVPAGIRHNVINTSRSKKLLLYTIYSPAHHKDGVVHRTKKDAEKDSGDHI